MHPGTHEEIVPALVMPSEVTIDLRTPTMYSNMKDYKRSNRAVTTSGLPLSILGAHPYLMKLSNPSTMLALMNNTIAPHGLLPSRTASVGLEPS